MCKCSQRATEIFNYKKENIFLNTKKDSLKFGILKKVFYSFLTHSAHDVNDFLF